MTGAIHAVIAPGLLLPPGDALAERYREFHVKPASVIASAPELGAGLLGPLTYRIQLALRFHPTPLGTAADDILQRVLDARVAIEVIATDRLTIGWEGPRWHVRYADGVAFEGACLLGPPAPPPQGTGLEIAHPGGVEHIQWPEVAAFAAFVNRGLDLGPDILVLAGSHRGPALVRRDGRPDLDYSDPARFGAGDTIWADAGALGRIDYRITAEEW